MSRRLDERGTRELLIELPNNYEARVEDVLATALAVSFRRWTGQRALRIDFEADVHSAPMDGLNITNTVGWFAVRYPMTLTLPESTEAGAQLKAIKEQLRAHSSRAAGFDRPDNLGTGDAAASVCFRYHSEGGPVPSDSRIFRAGGRVNLSCSPRSRRPYLLDVEAVVASGELELRWNYSSDLHTPATVEALADDFFDAMRSIVVLHMAKGAIGWSAYGIFDPSRAEP